MQSDLFKSLPITDLEPMLPAFKLGPPAAHVPTGAMYGFIGPNGAGKTMADGTPITRFQWLP